MVFSKAKQVLGPNKLYECVNIITLFLHLLIIWNVAFVVNIHHIYAVFQSEVEGRRRFGYKV